MENTQTILKRKETAFERAFLYYSLLSTANKLGLSDRHIQLLSYLSTNPFDKKEFMEKYNISEPYVNNIVHKLKKINILVKDLRYPELVPVFKKIDFNEDFSLIIKIHNV